MNMYLQIEDPDKKPRLILVDPACFCLSHPSTVTAFVTDIDKVVDNDTFKPDRFYFRTLLAKELMISCNLRRYFHWYELVLYPEEIIDNKKHTVVTAEKDNFVPIGLIEKGIKNVNENTENDITIIHDTIDAGHGEWIWYQDYIKKVVDAL